jgi:hypothetical protein
MATYEKKEKTLDEAALLAGTLLTLSNLFFILISMAIMDGLNI